MQWKYKKAVIYLILLDKLSKDINDFQDLFYEDINITEYFTAVDAQIMVYW